MDVGDPDTLEQALELLHTDLDHLIKLVEDRCLETLDDTGLVGFLQGVERLRNRLPLIDHQMINEGTDSGSGPESVSGHHDPGAHLGTAALRRGSRRAGSAPRRPWRSG